jgi:hypothetical protein
MFSIYFSIYFLIDCIIFTSAQSCSNNSRCLDNIRICIAIPANNCKDLNQNCVLIDDLNNKIYCKDSSNRCIDLNKTPNQC